MTVIQCQTLTALCEKRLGNNPKSGIMLLCLPTELWVLRSLSLPDVEQFLSQKGEVPDPLLKTQHFQLKLENIIHECVSSQMRDILSKLMRDCSVVLMSHVYNSNDSSVTRR